MGRAVVAALCLVSLPLAVLSGCTQDFDQFAPKGSSSGGSGATGGIGMGGEGAAQGGSGGSAPECDGPEDCDDGNDCTVDGCAAGSCTNEPEPDGLAPGYIDQDSDCVEDRCEGGVYMQDVADDTEVPDDFMACTTEVCSGGMIETTNLPAGTDCGANPPSNLACDDMGNCIGCTVPTDCGTDTECITYTCDPNMVCGFTATAAGTPTVGGQTAGDCLIVVCDGSGGMQNGVDNGDPPADGGVCLMGACNGGTPVQNPLAPETPCGGTNDVCNATGVCVDCFTNNQCTPPETCGGGGMTEVCGCTAADPCTGSNCGTINDTCGVPQTCSCAMGGDVCVANACCTPQSDAAACAAGGIECGGTVTNNCGQMVTCVCPGPTDVCNSNICCTPDPDPCMTQGWECGFAPDGCGGVSAAECGTCPPGQPNCNMGNCEM